tara:strand:+ start:384 stop:953 length:570 start_codon:yes stop_codon:yes gene_type:complete
MNITETIKKFWAFLKKDTWQSWFVSLILIIIFIKFIFFPTLSFTTGSPLPLVVVESCSMYHEASFDNWWLSNKAWYESQGIEKSDFESWPFKSGLNKGDIIFVWGRSEVKQGDIIIFNANARNPLIHRVTSLDPIQTKGDHNAGQLGVETNIPQSAVLGKSVVKIPLIGWLKLIFFEPFRQKEQRGLCK